MNDFFANLYELFGLIQGNFYNDLYAESIYTSLGIIMIASVCLVAIIYYYLINHPRFNRWHSWAIVGFGISLLNFIIDWIVASDKLTQYYHNAQQNLPYYWSDFIILAIFGAIWTFIVYFVFSFVVKWGSRNCKHTPFL